MSTTAFPAGDDSFEDVALKSVRPCGEHGWEAERVDGWSLLIPPESPIEPKSGMSLRLYGRGIGSPIRGMFLDGRRIFYRTEDEDARHYDVQTYGADAAAYVRRWDEQGHVWSIAMGGFGPGYEQALQLAMIEVLRHMIATKPDSSSWGSADGTWRAQADSMHEPLMPILRPLGLSGAQWGAACSLAAQIYRDGPIAVLKDADGDRKIQVSRSYPTLDPVILSALAAERETAGGA